MYKLTNQNSVVRIADGAIIPFDQGNVDFIEYMDWLKEGHTPAPADVPSGNAVIDEQIADIEQANPITHRTHREFMIGVQTMLAGVLNITVDQLLDPQDPHYSHAYARFVSVNQQIINKRRERVT